MRLHSLRLQAFGPFAGVETVDFDALSAGGLFLLHGATGAGKSTLFAAICFALYGRPPGDGEVVLRSHHAPPGLLTEVTLEATIAGRRLRITRVPAQERPRKSGRGTTLHRPQTQLSEWRAGAAGQGGGWRAVSTSHQEAGHELELLLGMSREQFCQVVLLPQNEFTRFLRASSAERRHLLGRLFRTGRFGRVESWLAERARATGEAATAAREDVLRLAERVKQAAGEALGPGAGAPDGTRPETLTGPARDWAHALVAAAEEAHLRALAAEREAAGALAGRRAHEGAVRELHRLQAAFAAATEQRERLDAGRPRLHELRARRALAQRAQRLAPFLHALDQARQAARRAEAAEATARQPLDQEQAALGAERLAQAERELRGEIGGLNVLLSEEAEDESAAARLRVLEQESAEAARRRQRARAWLDGEPALRAALTARLDAARAAAAEAARHADALHALGVRLAAARRRDTLLDLAERAAARAAELHATARAADEELTGIRSRRLDGLVGELAGALAEGEPCPVCGSRSHPAPAAPRPGRPTRRDEEAALTRQRRAEAEHGAAREEAAEAGRRAATAEGEAGEGTVADLAARHAALDERLAKATELAADAEPAAAELAALDRAHARHAEEETGALAAIAALRAEREALTARRAELGRRLRAARGPAATLAERVRQLTAAAEALSRAALAARAAEEAAREFADRAAAAEAACREAGFATVEEAQAAGLPEEALRAVEEEIEAHRAAETALAATLADPALREAARQPPADLESAATDLKAATEAHTAAVAASAAARARAGELAGLAVRLETAVARLEPLEAARRTARHLATLANGTSPSNALRMQLESYVLAARLEDVVRAANLRLSRMSDQRYTLAHSDDRAAHGARSGLGLTVVDAWTGRPRATDTLSGGESFYVSLSLALGLADVVTAEAGGSALDTLFIDEGFGSLDEDSLQTVMDVLDGLREHDRVVGVVSHVPDLRRRIADRLHVRKGPQGSTLTRHSAPEG
ncbi:AAA family ATPase [Streptomyces hoynatensis]|uniref:Nuclease SbcCD subunit C n=1 Tax=Streptomyces hoynatensis TaxID=1141874 RepID=A0A3A9YRW2_9ACTN|nr:SMC family ATPase [Streptomyces hoynatensis]RKN38529.1 SMC family ATPase [Streptomyces hoynatensis]